MDPETKCATCGHERKWHNPCTMCELKIDRADRCGDFQEPQEEPADG